MPRFHNWKSLYQTISPIGNWQDIKNEFGQKRVFLSISAFCPPSQLKARFSKGKSSSWNIYYRCEKQWFLARNYLKGKLKLNKIHLLKQHCSNLGNKDPLEPSSSWITLTSEKIPDQVRKGWRETSCNYVTGSEVEQLTLGSL